MRRRSKANYVLQPLEQRVFLSVTPSTVLTKVMRQSIIDHWVGSNKAALQTKLNTGNGAFDGALLTYMASRAGTDFFWNTSDIAGIKTFVNANIATSTTIANADSIVAHEFPDGDSGVYNVNLGSGDINWKTVGPSTDFVHTLNRQAFWQDLAQAYVFTGNASYVNELVSELASWSQQSPPLADPNAWASNDPPWEPLDVAQRTDNWVWAYQMVLGSAGWTGDANSLFVYELYQQGDFLRKVTPYDVTSNRAVFEAVGLMETAQLMPEFDNSADWLTYGRTLLFNSMDGQFNADGGQDESSPGYAGQVIAEILEMYWLDQKKGAATAWDTTRLTKLNNDAQSYVQLLSPNGNLAALSDTYRQSVSTFWDHPRIILSDTTDYPAAKPRMRDVWLFGTTTSNTIINAPITPALPNRGNTYSMPDSGYYVERSGADANARQVTFDAGPTGGQHGHFDLLSFELFGYGAPLIADPGIYTYDTSVRRNWAVSTPAHNTISVDDQSHAALEGVGNPGIESSTITSVGSGYQITASHRGYQGMVGAPVVARSMYFDGNGVMLLVDWGESTTSHTYSTSFLLPGTSTSSDLPGGTIRTLNSGGNVKITSLLQPGQSAFRDTNIPGTTTPVFTSSDPDANIADSATKFHIDQTGTFAGFVTLVNSYNGSSVPDITAQLIGTPTPGGTFQVQIFHAGVAAQLVTFTEPSFVHPPTNFQGAGPNVGANSIAYDASGQLHMAYNDTAEKDLKYAVRDVNGNWSIPQTIDAGLYAGGYPSLAIDSKGNPAIAYFDGNGGDLKYAVMTGGAWQVQTVDSNGSVGLYPSLIFSRKDGAMIAYYKRTTADLRLAIQVTGGWQITTVDSTGDVGRCTSMTLDPNRPTASKVAIAYEDSTHGDNKYAIQSGTGYTITTVDPSLTQGGGYTSLVWEPNLSSDNTYHPTMSYYDSGNTAVKFARQNAGVWSAQTVYAVGQVGLYTQMFYDVGGRANIIYFKKTNNTIYRATLKSGAWKQTYLSTGGREDKIAVLPNGAFALTDDDTDGLRVLFYGS